MLFFVAVTHLTPHAHAHIKPLITQVLVILIGLVIIVTRLISPEDVSKAAALYALSRDQSSLFKLSKDEIAEMVATKTLKGEDGEIVPH